MDSYTQAPATHSSGFYHFWHCPVAAEGLVSGCVILCFRLGVGEEEEEEYKGRSTKEEQTATVLLDLTRLSVYYTTTTIIST